MLRIVNEITHWDTNHINIKGNNILQICAKKDFRKCVQNILSCDNDEVTRGLLMHTNHHGNNALMQCVFKKSEGALNLLLGILLSMECNDTNKDLIYHIIHQRNTLGFTLLEIILHYKQGLHFFYQK